MTLIKLKGDTVENVLPWFYENSTDTEYFDDYTMLGVSDYEFSVLIEFETSNSYRYSNRSNPFIDERAVADVIRYLFSDTSKFKDLTAEEFKENLKKIFRLFVEICLHFSDNVLLYIYKLSLICA